MKDEDKTKEQLIEELVELRRRSAGLPEGEYVHIKFEDNGGGMSGQMVFERIRSINPDVKIIICSGQSDEDIREGILSTAGGFLKKPYRVNDLARTVREVLDF